MGEVKKKKKEELYASKKSYLKDDNTNSSQDLYPRITIVIARGSIINGVIEDRLRRKKLCGEGSKFPRCKCGLYAAKPHAKKPSDFIIHAGTNDVKRFTSREILCQLLNLKDFIGE